jgi:uncharacterized protein YidB (DUF937 family)
MGLLDSILGTGSGGAQLDPAGAGGVTHRGLAEAAMAMLTNRSTGGMAGLLEKFKAAGLGSQVASWVGTGANQPVTGEQVHAALGADQISELAQKFGLPPNIVSGHLAELLPALIDHATPDGQVPQGHGIMESILASVRQKFLGH